MKFCAILFILFLTATPRSFAQSVPKSYQGWLKGNMVIDGQVDTVNFRVALMVDGPYLLEPQYAVVTALEGKAVKTSAGQYAIERKEVGLPHRAFQRYYLFNLLTGTVSQFGKTPDSLEEIFPNDQKKAGYKLDGNRDAVLTNINGYKFIKDTAIDGHPWKIVEQASPQPGIALARILLRTDLPSFPIHPLSKQLDASYGGTALIIHYFTAAGHDMGVKWEFTPGLSQAEHGQLQRFIQAHKLQ